MTFWYNKRLAAVHAFVAVVLFWHSVPSCAIANDASEQMANDTKRAEYAEIRAVDAETGKGVPLVELITVNRLRFVTDNAGRIAFNEPGLMGREIFFTVRSHGYEMKKDGFGFVGVRITPKIGQVSEIKITRRNIAERLCRLTGALHDQISAPSARRFGTIA